MGSGEWGVGRGVAYPITSGEEGELGWGYRCAEYKQRKGNKRQLSEVVAAVFHLSYNWIPMAAGVLLTDRDVPAQCTGFLQAYLRRIVSVAT